jgi:hypothetical protein
MGGMNGELARRGALLVVCVILVAATIASFHWGDEHA